MFFELVLRARMGERSPRQIGRALSDGEIHPLAGAGRCLALAVTWYRSAIDAFSHA